MGKRIGAMMIAFGMAAFPLFASAAMVQAGGAKIIRVPKTAILSGRVVIGPRCPVEPCRMPLGAQRPSYEMKVVAFSADRDPQVNGESKIDRFGNYRMILPPGKYILTVSPNPWQPKCLDLIGPCPVLVGSIDVPREIIIKPGLNREDIHIDTGIRAVEQTN